MPLPSIGGTLSGAAGVGVGKGATAVNVGVGSGLSGSGDSGEVAVAGEAAVEAANGDFGGNGEMSLGPDGKAGLVCTTLVGLEVGFDVGDGGSAGG